MNNITISGNVGNAELKEVKGTALLEFSLAVKKNYAKDKNNDTEWFKCTLWGKRASALAQYIVKGAGLVVSGEMQINYNPEKKTCYPSVNVDQVDIMKWANDTQQAPRQTQEQQLAGFTPMAVEEDSMDIPF